MGVKAEKIKPGRNFASSVAEDSPEVMDEKVKKYLRGEPANLEVFHWVNPVL